MNVGNRTGLGLDGPASEIWLCQSFIEEPGIVYPISQNLIFASASMHTLFQIK